LLHPDRIVVGVEDAESERQLREIYQPIMDGKIRMPDSRFRVAHRSRPPASS